MFEYGFLLLSVIFTVIGLLLFKKIAISLETKSGVIRLVRSFFGKYLAFAFTSFLMAAILYILALTRLDLAVAFSFTGLSYILVLCGARLIFKERVNIYHIIGVLTIAIGLFVFHL